MKMNSDFQKIFVRLEKKRILLEKDSLKRHLSVGFMSHVYFADSNRGRLVIHIHTIHQEQKRQKIWGKIFVIGKLFDSFPELPTAPVVLAGTLGRNTYFIVQKFLPGRAAGKRILQKGLFVDTWELWSKKIERNIEKTIARVHQIPVMGYGWIENRGGIPRGKYKSWLQFLESEFNLWFKNIARAEQNSNLANAVKKHFEKNKKRFTIKKSFLVHGDLSNPGNILVRRERVTGFVDWEWSLAGDPAWEFAFNNRLSLHTYFHSFTHTFTKKEKKDFLESARLYEPLFLMWAMHVHSGDKNNLYKALKNHLINLGF